MLVKLRELAAKGPNILVRQGSFQEMLREQFSKQLRPNLYNIGHTGIAPAPKTVKIQGGIAELDLATKITYPDTVWLGPQPK